MVIGFVFFFSVIFLAPCDPDAFFCHSNMCINNTLVCNGMQNCVYPWDENQCKGEMSGLIVRSELKIGWMLQWCHWIFLTSRWTLSSLCTLWCLTTVHISRVFFSLSLDQLLHLEFKRYSIYKLIYSFFLLALLPLMHKTSCDGISIIMQTWSARDTTFVFWFYFPALYAAKWRAPAPSEVLHHSCLFCHWSLKTLVSGAWSPF